MKNKHNKSQSISGEVNPLALIVVVTVAILGLFAFALTLGNWHNVQANAGYATFVYTQPILGKSQYDSVIFGPNSTGVRWRAYGQSVAVTPYTYTEAFISDKGDAILAKDKLPLNSQAHIVWRLRPNEASVKQFLESFGGLEGNKNPDDIAKLAYEQFIREPFRTITRSVVASYNGLDVNESLPQIGSEIEKQTKIILNNTPFEVLSVVMGNSAPPQKVVDAIATRVALNQTLEQKKVEDEIATKNVDIERKNGEAAGAKISAEALERAKAISAITAVVSSAYIQYLQAENIKGAERVYVPLNAGPTLVNQIK